MPRKIDFTIQQGDIIQLSADVLVLKYAQAFYGVDRKVSEALASVGIPRNTLCPDVGDHRLVHTRGSIAARMVLFVGVVPLGGFGYGEITEFARKVSAILHDEDRDIKRMASTIHGTGYGLEDVTSFVSLYRGFLEAAEAGFRCERMQTGSFPADHWNKVKKQIEGASVVIAELSGSDPNVYLEVGYAWGKGCPTILLVHDEIELHYDVKSHKCLTYSSILALSDLLTKEIEGLRGDGLI